MDRKKYAAYSCVCTILCFAAMLCSFRGMFAYLADMFDADGVEEMGYAWFVPPFSLWLLWTKRASIRSVAADPQPSAAGLALAVPCLFLAWLGRCGLQVRFEQLGFIGLCVAVPWAVYGRRMARLAAPSALFLLFTVPLGNYLSVATVPLRLLAVKSAAALLSGVGMEVARTGTVLSVPGVVSVDIVEGCSGLRSLFALATLTAAYAWTTQPTLLRRAALFAFAVPIAVAGNIARIVSICAVGRFAGGEFATGFYHDYSGYVIFIVAILLMVAAGDAITRIAGAAARRRRERPAPQAPAPSPAPASSPAPVAADSGDVVPTAARRCLPLCVLALCAIVLGVLESRPKPEYMPVPDFSLPADVAGYESGIPVYCQNEQCGFSEVRGAMQAGAQPPRCVECGARMLPASPAEIRKLPKDTKQEKRVYSSRRAVFSVSTVRGGESKGSIHRPEMCLPTQGFLLSGPADIVVDGVPFRVLTLSHGSNPPGTFAYTFFNQDGYRTSSHAARIWRDVCDRTFRGRLDGWAMVTVAGYGPGPGGLDANSGPSDMEILKEFLRKLIPSIGGKEAPSGQ